jgi:hypothetical protein
MPTLTPIVIHATLRVRVVALLHLDGAGSLSEQHRVTLLIKTDYSAPLHLRCTESIMAPVCMAPRKGSFADDTHYLSSVFMLIAFNNHGIQHIA